MFELSNALIKIIRYKFNTSLFIRYLLCNIQCVRGCSPEHFALARLPRFTAYTHIRRCFSRAGSFARSRTSALSSSLSLSLSLSLPSAQLCYARALFARLSSLLVSCRAFQLTSPRASPLFSYLGLDSLFKLDYCS